MDWLYFLPVITFYLGIGARTADIVGIFAPINKKKKSYC